MQQFLRLSLLGAFLFLTAVACKNDPPVQEEEKKEITVPKFEHDSAYAYLAKQLSFGPRVPNTEAHRACKDWLVAQFKRFDAKVIEQDFKVEAYTGEVMEATNIIAQYNPENRKRVMLAAHWDSRKVADSPLSTERREEPILGADDGASGVAVILEMARLLQQYPIDLGIDLVLFDVEDQGENGGQNDESWGLGSQHWSRQPHARPDYGILLDMVGAKGARFPKEQYSVYFAPELVTKVWTLANRMGYGNFFANVNGGGVTDDHYFVNTIAGIPMIDVINLPLNSQNKGFGDHWHTHNDNLEVIDPRTLRAVGRVMTAVVYREAGGNF